ncbi:ATP-grasp domain-containing protein [Clostridiales bacterium]|nr:ATP-grasp domain-containing protein [Clostridiales bacterium]
MNKYDGKKLLILGGKPIGSCELVKRAKQMGIYTIVTDYLKESESPAKMIADETWDISTSEIDQLEEKARYAKVDGVYTGVHEFNIRKMIQLCPKLGLPCYCTEKQWNQLENKQEFKRACIEHGIPVSKEYKEKDIQSNNIGEKEFPVIVKPADGSGSRGFSICSNAHELEEAYQKAKQFTPTGSVLVEQLMDYRYSVIINYTVIDGLVLYSGMSDKRSKKVFDDGAPIMSFQCYPSEHENQYLSTINDSVKRMLTDLKIKNGVVWIEAFYNNGTFTFNEMGYRFGGSLTYYPVEYFYGINQLDIQIEYALTGQNATYEERKIDRDHLYCILPIHVKPGVITRIEGVEKLKQKSYLRNIVSVHYLGDTIKNWGSAQQVFAYIHFVAKDKESIINIESDIMRTIHVYDEMENEQLFNLFDNNCIN